MPMEIVRGQSKNPAATQALADRLSSLEIDGTLYLGYPVLATADEQVDVDALLVSSEHGLAAFIIHTSEAPTDQNAWDELVESQNRLYGALDSFLRRHKTLWSGRHMAVHPETATIFPSRIISAPEEGEATFKSIDEVAAWVQNLPALEKRFERALHAALQRVSTIKPAKKRANVAQEKSRGAILKKIESGIANLDFWQKQAAIESPEGPQRIRGLAGSGKTVVLALKAAYWHANHPEWRIAVTFHSRALYQQFEDLLRRFSFEFQNDLPDTDMLQVIHSWGSSRKAGLYSLMANSVGVQPLDFLQAKEKFGYEKAFQGACRDLLTIVERVPDIPPLFDAVLIDEAQDLPPEFFQLIYKFTATPKRIVWGFDELQRLSEAAMPSTEELFGTNEQGESNVSLETPPNSPRRDIVLPICYRNTPWALATAHSLGLGVYREGGLLQHPDRPELWHEIGYEVVTGNLVFGSRVTLRRSKDSSPDYFDELLDPVDSVQFCKFHDEEEQDRWIAEQINVNITQDELEPDDILIVLPDVYRAKTRGPRLISRLRRMGVEAHQIGVSSSADEIFRTGSVALAHIHRAKGNEAPMVYVADAHFCATNFNAVTRRNMLFTAMTRSRAWVRVCGHASSEKEAVLLDRLYSEAKAVRDNDFKMSFLIPTLEDLRQIRHLHRDRPAEDENAIRESIEGIRSIERLLRSGRVRVGDLPPDLQPLARQIEQGLEK